MAFGIFLVRLLLLLFVLILVTILYRGIWERPHEGSVALMSTVVVRDSG